MLGVAGGHSGRSYRAQRRRIPPDIPGELHGVERIDLLSHNADGPIGANVAGTSVSFQVDWVNETLHTGWPVLILGQAEQVDDPAIISSLEETHRAEPWADGPRTMFFRIIADQITGRHVRQV